RSGRSWPRATRRTSATTWSAAPTRTRRPNRRGIIRRRTAKRLAHRQGGRTAMRKVRVGVGIGLALAAAGLLAGAAIGQGAAANRFAGASVDDQRQIAADKEPGTWMYAGRTYDEQRYSPLASINRSNIKDL